MPARLQDFVSVAAGERLRVQFSEKLDDIADHFFYLSGVMFLGGVVADEFTPLDTLVFACKEADYGPDEHTIGHAVLVLFSLAKVSVVL